MSDFLAIIVLGVCKIGADGTAPGQGIFCQEWLGSATGRQIGARSYRRCYRFAGTHVVSAASVQAFRRWRTGGVNYGFSTNIFFSGQKALPPSPTNWFIKAVVSSFVV